MNSYYGKYMRAESFRKALVYQKKYLLILLGGFRDTEKDTLSLLAQMGVYPSTRGLKQLPGAQNMRARGKARWKGVVYAIIAVSRLVFDGSQLFSTYHSISATSLL